MNNKLQPINSVATACHVLDTLRRQGEMGVTEIAEELDLSKSTAHRHLTTLKSQNYVSKADNKYKLSLKYFGMAEQVKRQLHVYDEIVDSIDELARETGEVSQFALEEQRNLIYIYKSEGENAVQVVSDVGYKGSFHCTALGKATLAYLSEEEVHKIIDQHGLPKQTENTITEPTNLLEEIDEIQDRGYAIDNEEFMPGLKCVAVPVQIKKPAFIGAISISAPASRMDKNRIKKDLVPEAVNAANIIEVNALVGE